MKTLKEKIEYLKRVETGCIVDAFLKLGIDHYSIDSLKAFGQSRKFAGAAHTAFMERPEREVKSYSRFDSIDQCEAGDVLVTAGASGRIVTGDMFAKYAEHAGLAAWIIEGKIRDSEGIDGLPMCTCCEGASNYLWRHGTKITALDVPVKVCGTVICPGDILIGDSDGILVIPKERLDEVIHQVEYVVQVESEVDGIFERGENLAELLNDVDIRKARLRPEEEEKRK